jgi:hypothetical protein
MTMHDHTARDDGLLRLGRAAELISNDYVAITPDDMMEVFKRAIFAGDLTRENADLHMEITVPRCTLPPMVAAMAVIPRALYAVNRSTVASVSLCANALPGKRNDWERLFDDCDPDHDDKLPYSTLATIPFRDYPEIGRRELEMLLVQTSRLSEWLAVRQSTSSPCDGNEPLSDGRLTGQSTPAQAALESRGRPQKPSWPRVAQLVRDLARDHPDWQKKQLAFEAWNLARQEFPESELPSVATIQRDMVQILRVGSA